MKRKIVLIIGLSMWGVKADPIIVKPMDVTKSPMSVTLAAMKAVLKPMKPGDQDGDDIKDEKNPDIDGD